MFKYKLFTKIISCSLAFSLIACSTNISYAKEENISNKNSNIAINNDDMQSLEITKNLVNDGWITKDNNDIYFTEKSINNLKENKYNKNCVIYNEKNSIRIVNTFTGGQNAFVYNPNEYRFELFISHDTNQCIIDHLSAAAVISEILGGIIPGGYAIGTIVSGIITLGAFALSCRDRGNGIVILLHTNLVPYWVCTQA